MPVDIIAEDFHIRNLGVLFSATCHVAFTAKTVQAVCKVGLNQAVRTMKWAEEVGLVVPCASRTPTWRIKAGVDVTATLVGLLLDSMKRVAALERSIAIYSREEIGHRDFDSDEEAVAYMLEYGEKENM